MIVFVIPLGGIVLSVILMDSIPDSTVLWSILFAITLVIMTVSEIRSYVILHKKLHEKHVMEQEAMLDLFQSRMISQEKKPSRAVDESKLIEQMAGELKSRLGSSNNLSAENIKKMTKELTAQLPLKN